MKSIGLIVALAAGLGIVAFPAHAIPRTFVAGTGGGATCTRALPCATLQAAHDATDVGGEINCVDAGNFGAVAITKPITIDCTGTLGASFFTSGPISINAPLVTVRLRNLTIAAGSTIATAVSFSNGSALFIENCIIAPGGWGITFSPPNGVTAKLFVSDTMISHNAADGILVNPSGTGSSHATLDGIRLEKNNIGIHATGDTSTGLIVTHFRNSVVSGNVISGIRAFSLPAKSTNSVTVDRTSSTLNSGDGIFSSGPLAFVLLGRTTLMSNGQGITSDNGGSILSYQNNHLTGNVADGVPTGLLNVK
jgi:hypothetical protein